MENQIRELVELLAKFTQIKVNPSYITVEQMPLVLENLQELKEWIEMVQGEALHRINEGVPVKGYTIRLRQYRQIADMRGAIEALRRYNPQAAGECVQERLANITHIKKVIGKSAFEEVLGQFTATKTSQSLMKIPNDCEVE